MDKKIKEVTISSKEMVDVLQIIHIRKVVGNKQENVDEVVLMESLIYEIFNNIDRTEDNCIVKLDNETRFAVWLCLNSYVEFLLSTETTDDLEYYEKLQDKFSGI